MFLGLRSSVFVLYTPLAMSRFPRLTPLPTDGSSTQQYKFFLPSNAGLFFPNLSLNLSMTPSITLLFERPLGVISTS